MFGKGDSSPEPPSHLRRRYQAVRDRQQKYSGHFNGSEQHPEGQNGLQMSMHLPREPFGNRFGVLTPQSPLNHGDHIPPYYRRYRHSKGSKEGKRRRDARRNRRKLAAAQMLDEYLYQDTEKPSTNSSIRRPPQCRFSFPEPMISAIPSPAKAAQVPDSPPELPSLHFGGLDLIGDIPQLASETPLPTPPATPPLAPQLPSWCPPLPAFINNPKWSDFPVFFDLSSLPEPVEPRKPENRCQDLQLWQPKISPQPKKQSRYFPAPTQAKSKVRLPPSSCKLHEVDRDSDDVSSQKSFIATTHKLYDERGIQAALAPKPTNIGELVEQAVKAIEIRSQSLWDEQSDAYAANLWNILTSCEKMISKPVTDPYMESFSYSPLQSIHATPYEDVDQKYDAFGVAFELDSTEIPFVHANSLTGYTNERADSTLPVPVEHVEVADSSWIRTPVQELTVELCSEEEIYADAVLAALELPVDLPPLPPSPSPTADAGCQTVLEEPLRLDDYSKQDAQSMSDAHYNSEQALFQPASPALEPAVDFELIDIAESLEMGHAANCWCRDCGEVPELIGADDLPEDEGWISVVQESASKPLPIELPILSEWEDEWGTFVGQDEDDEMLRPFDKAVPLSWDEAFPCLPSSRAHSSW